MYPQNQWCGPGVTQGVVRGSHRVTALYHCFSDKITVIPLLSECNYSFASVTKKRNAILLIRFYQERRAIF